MKPPVTTARQAQPADAPSIASIYNEGIDDRVATFETRHRTPHDILGWLGGRHPVIVVENDGAVVAFANASVYRSRECYEGIAEFSVYVARASRGRGYGRAALDALCGAVEHAGFWKLVSRVFVENTASRALLKRTGFREVGIYKRHGRLDGTWRDVVIVEKRLGIAADVSRESSIFGRRSGVRGSRKLSHGSTADGGAGAASIDDRRQPDP